MRNRERERDTNNSYDRIEVICKLLSATICRKKMKRNGLTTKEGEERVEIRSSGEIMWFTESRYLVIMSMGYDKFLEKQNNRSSISKNDEFIVEKR